MGKDLLSIGAAAKYLSVSIDTLRRWDKEGKIHSTRIDGKNRFFSFKELKKVKERQDMIKLPAARELVYRLQRLEDKRIKA
jgi:excisionase family DNA binding protein